MCNKMTCLSMVVPPHHVTTTMMMITFYCVHHKKPLGALRFGSGAGTSIIFYNHVSDSNVRCDGVFRGESLKCLQCRGWKIPQQATWNMFVHLSLHLYGSLMSPLNITQPLDSMIGIWSIMATIRWCPIYRKWDIYQPLFKPPFIGELSS